MNEMIEIVKNSYNDFFIVQIFEMRRLNYITCDILVLGHLSMCVWRIENRSW